jgi:hypothetical protein
VDINVRLRFNKRTGEVEFVVEAPDSRLPEAEHNRRHDEVAAEVGRILEQHPLVDEVTGVMPLPAAEQEPATPETPTPTPQRRTQTP